MKISRLMVFGRGGLKNLTLIAIILGLSLAASTQFFGRSKDVEQYSYFFYNLESDYFGRFEPLFVMLTYFVKWVNDEFSFFILTITFVSLSIKFFILSRFKFVFINLAIYLAIIFPIHELTQYRASISLAALYLAYYVLYSGRSKYISFLLFGVAVLFHYSAIAFLPIVLFWGQISRLHLSKRSSYFWIIVFCIFGVSLFLFRYAVVEFAGEMNNTLRNLDSMQENIFSSRNIVLTLLVLIGVRNWNRIAEELRPFLGISLYGLILWILFFGVSIFPGRLLEATFFSYLVWIAGLRGLTRATAFTLLGILASYLVYKVFYVDYFFV